MILSFPPTHTPPHLQERQAFQPECPWWGSLTTSTQGWFQIPARPLKAQVLVTVHLFPPNPSSASLPRSITQRTHSQDQNTFLEWKYSRSGHSSPINSGLRQENKDAEFVEPLTRLELFVWQVHLPVPRGSGIFYSKQDWLVSPPHSQPHLQQRDAPVPISKCLFWLAYLIYFKFNLFLIHSHSTKLEGTENYLMKSLLSIPPAHPALLNQKQCYGFS